MDPVLRIRISIKPSTRPSVPVWLCIPFTSGAPATSVIAFGRSIGARIISRSSPKRRVANFSGSDLPIPVSFSPYLKTLNQHFGNQYVLTFLAQANAGDKRLHLKTEVPHATLVGPSKVIVSGGK